VRVPAVSVLRSIALVALFLVSAFAVGAEKEARVFKTKRVVILVIDGPRYTETWGEPQRQYIPRQAKELAPQGVLFTDFRNDGPTYTNAGHSAMLTGFYQEINNTGKELPKNPSLMQRYLAEGNKPNTDAWVIASKDKLQILANSMHPDWKYKYLASTDCGKKGNTTGYREDAVTMSRIEEILPEHKPHLVLINFKEPDASGHARNWEKYLRGIEDTDGYAYRVWNLIQSLPDFKDQTALFITNDHGRHDDKRLMGFTSHGDKCFSCRHISLLALGPDFKKGAVIEKRRGQIDIAVTAAKLLGLKIKGSKGRVMEEMFEEPAKN